MGCLLWLYQFLCFVLLFHLHFLATCSSSSLQLCPHDQSVALLQFKNNFSIDSSASRDCESNGITSYPKTDSWKVGTDCCSWDGVTCDSLTGHVIGLDLSCSRLADPISPNSSLFQLSHLKSFNLASNCFNDSRISHQFGWFVSLTHLNLSNSCFYGQVPSQISHLSRLISLDLSSYYSRLEVSLETPTLKDIVQNLTEVRELFLNNINTSSVAPDFLINLSSSLTSFSVSECQLRGNFPSNIFYRPKLWFLRLSSNSNLRFYFPKSNWSGPLELLDVSNTLVSGQLPEQIVYLKSLKYLSLSNCNVTGSIPSSLKNLEKLTYLDLSSNNFKAPLPSSIFELVNLTTLSLSSNNFSGNVESYMFSKLKNLKILDLSYNSLSLISTNLHLNYTLSYIDSLSLSSRNMSEIPNFLRASKHLKRLDLSNNKIGNIPKWMWNVGLDSLFYLNFSHNILTSVQALPWRNLEYLDLHSNLLQGPVPIPPLHSLRFFSISQNKLTREIPSLICNASFLEILDFSHNNLSGILPRCIGNFSESLSMLNLRMNNFHGTIPTVFSKRCGLRNLNFYGNQLDGSLPQTLVNCRNLEVLDLGNNKIDDKFPYWLESLAELQILVLRSNKFHGFVQDFKANHSKLQIFDLSNNEFKGPLPTEYIKNLNAMMDVTEGKSDLKYMGEKNYLYDYTVTVTIKNFDIEMVKIFTFFTSIDVSKNRFEGEIPQVIGKLSSLKGLNLSHNNLGGHIPPTIGNLTNLEWLDLSSNKLLGKIPEQLANLTSLEVLNLSHNQLVGSIPRGKQFNTFNNDTYEGNLGLCGFPLNKSCSIVEPPPPMQSTFHKEDDSNSEFRFGWKVVLIGYGCGMVIGLAMGYFVFRTGNPKWFVMLVNAKRLKKNACKSGGRRL